MSTSKKTSTPVVVGRRLRRYLGALLALGFGAAWWSFVPPSQAAASVPAAHAHVERAHVAAIPSVPPVPLRRTNRLAALPHPIRKRVHHSMPHVKPPVLDPLPVIETPVIETPVIDPLPVIETPVIETPPVVEPVDEPTLPPIRIRTRSS